MIDSSKKEIFDLKLRLFFYETQLSKLSPAHLESVLKEHVLLKVEFQSIKAELRKYKKMLLDASGVIAGLTATGVTRDGQTGEEREWEKRYEEERLARQTVERKLDELANLSKGESIEAELVAGQIELLDLKELVLELESNEVELKHELDEARDRLEVALEDIEQLKISSVPLEDDSREEVRSTHSVSTSNVLERVRHRS